MMRSVSIHCLWLHWLLILFTAVPSFATEKPKLVVGGDHQNPPFEFLEQGAPTGFNVELMRAVAEELGDDLEIRLAPWAEVRTALELGQIDALAGMYFSEERSHHVDFSLPHTMVTMGLYVRLDSAIQSIEDIRGKEVIVQRGDIVDDYLRENKITSHIVQVMDPADELRLLASGRHDCALMPSSLQCEYLIRSLGLTNIKGVGANLPQLRYCFAVPKGNSALRYRIDEALNILKVNGKYKQIYDKWFGIYEKRDLWQTIRYFIWAMALIMALLGASFIWSWSLRRQVRIRTAELREREKSLRFTQYAIDKTTDQAYWMTEGGHLFYVNEAASRSLGYSVEELTAMSIPDLDPNHPTEAFAEHWRDLRQYGSVTMESMHRAKDGRVYPVEIRANHVIFDGTEYNCAFATDISERKRAEEVLRESEEKFRVLAETLPAAIFLYQEQGHVYVNPSAALLTGYSDQEFLQMNPWDFVHEDYRNIVKTRGLARLKGEPVPSRYEIKIKAKSGEEKWVFLSAGRIDYRGVPAVIISMFDITDRKQMEEDLRDARNDLENRVFERTAELQRSNELLEEEIRVRKQAEEAIREGKAKYQAIVDNFDGYIYICSQDYRVEFMNGRLIERTGYDGTGQFCYKVMHDRDSACPWCVNERVFAGETLHWEMLNPRDNHWYHVVNVPIRHADGSMSKQSMMLDITDRKQADEELRKANMVVENSPVVLFRCKAVPGWPVQLVSRNVVQFGYEPEEFLSGELTYSSIVYSRDLEKMITDTEEYSVKGKDQWVQEYRIVTRQGDIRWIVDEKVCERNEEGTVTHYEGVVIDVTERRKAEEQLILQQIQLRELNSTLEERVQAEVKKNREKDVMLIQQNRQAALGEILDHIAHQWKHPLSTISLTAYLLKTDTALNKDSVQEATDGIIEQVNDLTQMLNDYRDFYRPDKEKSIFRITEGIGKALSFIMPVLSIETIKLEVDADPGLFALGYPKEFAQVLLNLVSNARDAFKERQVKNPKIVVQGFEEDKIAVVTVTDNAGGISEAVLGSIFEMNFTTKEQLGGTGIGLYMSRNIIERDMGGDLTAVNVADGAQFRIRLPIAEFAEKSAA